MSMIEPDIPNIEDVVGVTLAKINISVKEERNNNCRIEKQFSTKYPFTFIIYKVKGVDIHSKEAFMCACLEIGTFHISRENDVYLVTKTSDLVAQYIKYNLLDLENDMVFKKMNSNYMNKFWDLLDMYQKNKKRDIEKQTPKSKDELLEEIDYDAA